MNWQKNEDRPGCTVFFCQLIFLPGFLTWLSWLRTCPHDSADLVTYTGRGAESLPAVRRFDPDRILDAAGGCPLSALRTSVVVFAGGRRDPLRRPRAG